MVDELFDRQYRAGRNAMNDSMADGMKRLAASIRTAFEVLVKIEYQSPWTARTKRVRFN